jgi:hypothetical protein
LLLLRLNCTQAQWHCSDHGCSKLDVYIDLNVKVLVAWTGDSEAAKDRMRKQE